MLARIIRTVRKLVEVRNAAVIAQLEIESSPVWNGETRVINVSKPVLDESGKPVRDLTADPVLYPKGKLVRVSEAVEVPVSVQSRYEKATRNRRNAARRITQSERAFALKASEMSVESVVAELRKIYG